MAAPINNTVPLRDVIYLFSEAAKKSGTEFLRLWRLAFRGFIHMGLSTSWASKTVPLNVNANNTVTLPDDYMQWISITDPTNSYSLYHNSKLTKFKSDNTTRMGSIGDGNETGFDVDTKNRCIILGTDYGLSKVELVYMFSPEQDNDYEIPIQFQEAMLAWLGWQDIAYLPSTGHVGNNTIQLRSRNFKNQLSVAKKLFKPFRLQQVENVNNIHTVHDL